MTRLKLAISHYDRFVPLLEGVEAPEGFDLDVLHVSQSNYGRYGQKRHERMLRDREFDVAEVSFSSYIMERTRSRDFTAIPVFPRRLFSQSQIWINANGRVKTPQDLVGKRVGLNTFQTTLSVLAKGDLQADHGVPWRSIEWVVSKDETIPFEAEAGVSIVKAPDDTNIGDMLIRGEIDAIFRPHPPNRRFRARAKSAACSLIRRPRKRAITKSGVSIRSCTSWCSAQRCWSAIPCAAGVHGHVPQDRSGDGALLRRSNWSRLAWGRLHLEEERKLLGRTSGRSESRKPRQHGAVHRYSLDQGLLPRRISVDELF